MYKSIGIDFGTSASSVFASVKGTPQVIFSRTKERFTPSVVAVNNERISVGDMQKPGAVSDLKRIIGLSYYDHMVRRYIEDFQIKLEETTDGAVKVPVNGKQLSVEEVIALLFRDMTYGLKIKKIELAVITVPASFGSIRRQAIRNAAAIAGFRDVELIDETTAAAVAFAKERKDNARLQENPAQDTKETILIFQLGGGTTDVAIFEITTKWVKLLGSASSCDLGGNEFDRNLLEHLAEKKIRTVEDKNRAGLMQLCKEAKEFLTSARNFRKEDTTITKNDFNTASKDLLTTIGAMVDLAIQAASWRLDMASIEVDEYILIGQGSQIPCVKDVIERKLGKEKRSDILDICEAAVKGAAIYAKTSRSNSKRNSHFRKKKDVVKIQKTNTHFITINGNQITNTHGLNKALTEKLRGELPQIGKLIEITVRTELRELRQDDITKSKKNVDDLIEQDEVLQRMEEKQSNLQKDLLKLQDELSEVKQNTLEHQKKSINYEAILNWCTEKLKWLQDNDRIPKEELDKCKKELNKYRKQLKGEAMLDSNSQTQASKSRTSPKDQLDRNTKATPATSATPDRSGAQASQSSTSAKDKSDAINHRSNAKSQPSKSRGPP